MKKLFSVLLIITAIVSSGFMLSGCKNDPLATVDGVEIRNVEIYQQASGYFSFAIGLQNTKDQTKTFDMTKIVLKLNNEILLDHDGTEATVGKKQYRKWIALLDVPQSDLKVGDKVAVYYDGQKLDTITVYKY